MAKDKKSVFYCQNCGYESTRWLGQCPACHQWNTFAEEVVSARAGSSASSGTARRKTSAEPKALSEINTESGARISTGIGELDRVLGGGIVQGSLILIGGDPGIGKSTLLLQVCRNLSLKNRRVL